MNTIHVHNVGDLIHYQSSPNNPYMMVAKVQEVSLPAHVGESIKYKVKDEWISEKDVWFYQDRSYESTTTGSQSEERPSNNQQKEPYKDEPQKTLADLAFKRPTTTQPMSQLNDQMTVIRSIELRPGDSWSYVITDSQHLEVNGIAIYCTEPNQPKKKMMGTDTKTARAIAKAILELTENNG